MQRWERKSGHGGISANLGIKHGMLACESYVRVDHDLCNVCLKLAIATKTLMVRISYHTSLRATFCIFNTDTGPSDTGSRAATGRAEGAEGA